MIPPASAVNSRAGRRRPAVLRAPGRWAGLDRHRALATVALLVVLLFAAIVAAPGAGGDRLDGSLDAALVDGVRHGGDVYAVAADAVHAAGLPASVRTVPLPTLAVVEGKAPTFGATAAIMLLAVLVVIAWYARFGDLIAERRVRVAALALMLIGAAVALRPSMVAVPEAWAGMLVALSLARRAPGRVVEPVAWGLAAAMLTPAALPYAAVMMAFAVGDRGAREVVGWAAVLLAGGAVVALHAHALASIAVAGPAPDVAMLGPEGVLASLAQATGLRVLPLALAVSLGILATLGWAIRREPAAGRVTGLILAQAAVIATLNRPDAALIVAPLLPLGLLMVPDALRNLTEAALPTRRFTVTRSDRAVPR